MARRPVGQHQMSLTCDSCKKECSCINGPTVDNKWVCDSCNVCTDSDAESIEEDFHCERCGCDSETNTCHPFGCILLCDKCGVDDKGIPQCPKGYEGGGCEICEQKWEELSEDNDLNKVE